jgi:hypothetical protein
MLIFWNILYVHERYLSVQDINVFYEKFHAMFSKTVFLNAVCKKHK